MINSMKLKYEKAELGFWLYLMTDVMLFASLFATYLILRNNTAGGPSGQELFEPRFILLETLLLLTSSLTCGLAVTALRFSKKNIAVGLLCVTILLGIGFIGLELSEFVGLVQEGHSWQTSAFLSAFFTLVGTHGLHILVGLLWALGILWYVIKHGATANSLRKFNLFALFWHFLDIVWVFIFTIVYMLGIIS